MKPVGLRDPRTGKTPWAVVQLRKENLRADSYNLVGFQNHLKFGEQARVLRLIPGLENARFLRYGQIHRNTYICAPLLLDETLRLKQSPCILFAGQLSGVEGYTESIATGMLAGIYAASLARGEEPTPAPRASALGSLVHYITHADPKNFQPANITFDLLEPLEEELRKKVRDKKERHRIVCERALAAFDAWWTLDPRIPPAELRPRILRNSVVRCFRFPERSTMRAISAADSVSLAVQRTRQFLFTNFSWGTYLKLGWSPSSLKGSGATPARRATVSALHRRSLIAKTAGLPPPHFQLPQFNLTPLQIAQIVAALLLVIVLTSVIVYLITRLRFAYFHCLTSNTTEISPGWSIYQSQASRFFWLNLVVGFCFLLLVGFIAIPFAAGFWHLFQESQNGASLDFR